MYKIKEPLLFPETAHCLDVSHQICLDLGHIQVDLDQKVTLNKCRELVIKQSKDGDISSLASQFETIVGLKLEECKSFEFKYPINLTDLKNLDHFAIE